MIVLAKKKIFRRLKQDEALAKEVQDISETLSFHMTLNDEDFDEVNRRDDINQATDLTYSEDD